VREGWLDEDYLVLLSDHESSDASRKYGIHGYLPGYRILGLRGWDDFIVRDATGCVYTVPSVPMASRYLSAWTVPADSELLKPDLRFTGKIKWYTKPIVFGGDPSDPNNILWISHEQHMQVVTWWNSKYQESNAGSGNK
jgi:hypothetical protein